MTFKQGLEKGMRASQSRGRFAALAHFCKIRGLLSFMESIKERLICFSAVKLESGR